MKKGESDMLVNEYIAKINENGSTYLHVIRSFESNQEQLDKPEKAVEFINEIFDAENLAEEHVYLIGVNNKTRPIGVFETSHGTCSTVILNPREILLRLLLLGASFGIILHNHPSGDSSASDADINATGRLYEAANILNIPILDHIIIGKNKFFSFAEHDWLK